MSITATQKLGTMNPNPPQEEDTESPQQEDKKTKANVVTLSAGARNQNQSEFDEDVAEPSVVIQHGIASSSRAEANTMLVDDDETKASLKKGEDEMEEDEVEVEEESTSSSSESEDEESIDSHWDDLYPPSKFVRPILFAGFPKQEIAKSFCSFMEKEADMDFKNQIDGDENLGETLQGLLDETIGLNDYENDVGLKSQVMTIERGLENRLLSDARQYRDMKHLQEGYYLPSYECEAVKNARSNLESTIRLVSMVNTKKMRELVESVNPVMESEQSEVINRVCSELEMTEVSIVKTLGDICEEGNKESVYPEAKCLCPPLTKDNPVMAEEVANRLVRVTEKRRDDKFKEQIIQDNALGKTLQDLMEGNITTTMLQNDASLNSQVRTIEYGFRARLRFAIRQHRDIKKLGEAGYLSHAGATETEKAREELQLAIALVDGINTTSMKSLAEQARLELSDSNVSGRMEIHELSKFLQLGSYTDWDSNHFLLNNDIPADMYVSEAIDVEDTEMAEAKPDKPMKTPNMDEVKGQPREEVPKTRLGSKRKLDFALPMTEAKAEEEGLILESEQSDADADKKPAAKE